MDSQHDTSSIKIKTEAQVEAAKAKAKPKFTPKAPPKKEIVEVVAAPVPVASESSKRQGPGARGKGGRDFQNRGEGRGRDGSGRGRDGGRDGRGGRDGGRDVRGGGRGRWVMPTGLAFFTGNASALGQNKNNYVIGGPVAHPKETNEDGEDGMKVDGGGGSSGPTGIKTHGSASGSVSGSVSGVGSGAGGGGGSSSSSRGQYLQAPTKEIDSDSEDDENVANREHMEGAVEEDEQWPPADGAYNPLAPLSLPFGPKTSKERHRVANAPILADPKDEAGLYEEESRNIFLLQLPSQLRLSKPTGDSQNQASSSSDDASDSSTGVKKGSKIGKMQLLRSGKVMLTLTDGRRFEVNSGMYTSFAQYVGAVVLDDEAILKAHSDSSATAAAALQSKKPSKKLPASQSNKCDMSENELVLGKLLIMGNITKKIVITPDYPIGNPRKIGTKGEEGEGGQENEIDGFESWTNSDVVIRGDPHKNSVIKDEDKYSNTDNNNNNNNNNNSNSGDVIITVPKKEKITKVAAAKIVPKGKKVVTVKSEPLGQKGTGGKVGNSSGSSGSSGSSSSSSSSSIVGGSGSSGGIGNNDGSNSHGDNNNMEVDANEGNEGYYEGEEEYEGGHMDEDDGDD